MAVEYHTCRGDATILSIVFFAALILNYGRNLRLLKEAVKSRRAVKLISGVQRKDFSAR
jgi:hypothetical protein